MTISRAENLQTADLMSDLAIQRTADEQMKYIDDYIRQESLSSAYVRQRMHLTIKKIPITNTRSITSAVR